MEAASCAPFGGEGHLAAIKKPYSVNSRGKNSGFRCFWEPVTVCDRLFGVFSGGRCVLRSFRAVEDIGGQESAGSGEGVGQAFRESEPGEVVTNCDHLRLFIL